MKAKPCPFCSVPESGVCVASSSVNKDQVFILCLDCSSRGPAVNAHGNKDNAANKALDLWNYRSYENAKPMSVVPKAKRHFPPSEGEG